MRIGCFFAWGRTHRGCRRLALGFAVGASTSTGLLAAQETGTLQGAITFAGTAKLSLLHVTGIQEVAGFHTMAFLGRDGIFSISEVPVGPMRICIQAAHHRSIIDTVLVSEDTGRKLSYKMVLDQPRRDPYPLCDFSLPTLYVEPIDSVMPLDHATATGAFSALLEYYQRDRYATVAVDHCAVVETQDGDPAPCRPRLAMAPGREATGNASYVTWLETLAPAQACLETDLARCPQQDFTTFLMFSQVGRLHVDTLKIVVLEQALDPAACRAQESFTGGSLHGFLLSRVSGEWSVIGYAPGYSETWSGVCGPHE